MVDQFFWHLDTSVSHCIITLYNHYVKTVHISWSDHKCGRDYLKSFINDILDGSGYQSMLSCILVFTLKFSFLVKNIILGGSRLFFWCPVFFGSMLYCAKKNDLMVFDFKDFGKKLIFLVVPIIFGFLVLLWLHAILCRKNHCIGLLLQF